MLKTQLYDVNYNKKSKDNLNNRFLYPIKIIFVSFHPKAIN